MWELEALVCGNPLHVAMVFSEENQDSPRFHSIFITALPLSSKTNGCLTRNPNTLTMDLANIQRSPLFLSQHITSKQKINRLVHPRKSTITTGSETCQGLDQIHTQQVSA